MERMNQRILVACNIFAILFFISSCKNIKPLKDTTDCDNMNLKSNVCLIIQEDFDIQNGRKTSSNTTIFKFNHHKNLLKEIKGKEITSYSYDNSGRLIVEKHSKDIITLSEETDFINVSDYKKYYYNAKCALRLVAVASTGLPPMVIVLVWNRSMSRGCRFSKGS